MRRDQILHLHREWAKQYPLTGRLMSQSPQVLSLQRETLRSPLTVRHQERLYIEFECGPIRLGPPPLSSRSTWSAIIRLVFCSI